MSEVDENNKIAPPHCDCDPPLTCSLRMVTKENENKGKYFFCCPIYNPDLKRSKCDYFIWEEVWRTHGDPTRTTNVNHVNTGSRSRHNSQTEEQPNSRKLPSNAPEDYFSDSDFIESASQAIDKLEADYLSKLTPSKFNPRQHYSNDYRNNVSTSAQTPSSSSAITADQNNMRSAGLATPNTTPEKHNRGIIRNTSRLPPPTPNFSGGHLGDDPFSNDDRLPVVWDNFERSVRELKAYTEKSKDLLIAAQNEINALSRQNNELKKEIGNPRLAISSTSAGRNDSNNSSNTNANNTSNMNSSRGGDDGSSRPTEWSVKLLRHENASLKSRIVELEKEVEDYKRDDSRPLTRKRVRT